MSTPNGPLADGSFTRPDDDRDSPAIPTATPAAGEPRAGGLRIVMPLDYPAAPPEDVLVGATGRVAWNSLMQGSGKLLGYAGGVIVLGLTARLLSQTSYGYYTTAFVYISFVYILADAGISTIGVREAAHEPHSLPSILSAVIALKLLVAVLVYGLSLVVMALLPYTPQVKLATVVLAASLFFVSIGSAFDVAFQSRLRMRYPTLADLSLRGVMLAGTAALFAFAVTHPSGQGLLFAGVVAISAAGNIASFLVRWYGVRRLVRLSVRVDLRYWAYLLAAAAPMGLALILAQIHYKADTILLSLLQLHHPQDVAIYGVAYKVIDFLLSLFGVFAALVFPVLARYSEQPAARYREATRRVLDATVALALPTSIGVVLLAPGIVVLLGGARYTASVGALRVLAVSAIFSFTNMIYDYLIIVANRQKSLIWVNCVDITANVALNLYAIPRYSYMGSAVATNITEFMGMAMAIVIANRIARAVPSTAVVAKVLLACGAMALAVLVVQHVALPRVSVLDTVLLAALGAAVYAVLLLALGGIDASLLRLASRRIPLLRRFTTR